jgi:hypothetical protein
MNKQEVYLPQPRRAELLRLIAKDGDVWDRARDKYNEARNSLKSAFVQAMAKERGVDKVLGEVAKLKSQLKKAEQEIELSCFEVDGDGDFDLRYDAPHEWHQRLSDQLDEKLGTKSEVLERPFEHARLQLLMVQTAQQAAEVVEPLLNFEVRVK